MQPDATDWEIIKLLSKSQMTNSAVAEKLDLNEATIRQRVKKLKKNGIIKISAQTNPDTIENHQLVLVMANVDSPKLLKVKAEEISNLENVLSVSVVAGQYDLIFEVLVSSNKGLVKFITDELSTIDGLSKTETFVTLKTFKKYI
ncbi:Lrp/AsnC family transcriptional regulator [Bacteroidota bacterium]